MYSAKLLLLTLKKLVKLYSVLFKFNIFLFVTVGSVSDSNNDEFTVSIDDGPISSGSFSLLISIEVCNKMFKNR
jgi:hypothetical protein